MTTLIFLFALLTMRPDSIVCDLWTRALTTEAFAAACPANLPLEGLRVDVIDVETLEIVCTRPAQSLRVILEDCSLPGPLDAYVLRIVKPAYEDLACMVESINADSPSAEEIAAQCPGISGYTVRAAGSRPAESEAFACPVRHLQTGFGLYEQALGAGDLVTYDELLMLAGQLIWFGHIDVSTCAGGPSVTPEKTATPCGYLSARDDVILWQNQFNQDIYNAALTYNVPAKLLKRMMMVESQFWPFFAGPAGETGIMQITDNGFDTLLRWDLGLDPEYLSRDDTEKAWSRNVTRETLTCNGCNLLEAIEQIKTDMPIYARLLAAYHCRAVTINPALTDADAWRQTVVNYNGVPEYLLRIEP